MSNFDGMGTLLYPVFEQFYQQRKHTVWWASGRARQQVEAIGVPPSAIFEARDAAVLAVAERRLD